MDERCRKRGRLKDSSKITTGIDERKEQRKEETGEGWKGFKLRKDNKRTGGKQEGWKDGREREKKKPNDRDGEKEKGGRRGINRLTDGWMHDGKRAERMEGLERRREDERMSCLQVKDGGSESSRLNCESGEN